MVFLKISSDRPIHLWQQCLRVIFSFSSLCVFSNSFVHPIAHTQIFCIILSRNRQLFEVYIYISNDRYIKGVCIIMRTGFRWSSIILQYISEFNLVIPIVALPSILIILITQIFPFTLERRHPSNSSYFYPILS